MQQKTINFLHILTIVGVGIIVTIPAIFHGVFEAHDLIPYHLKWSKHFVEQFWQGDLYPRWLLNMNNGLGSPTFFFYAPIPYYFSSLFHALFPNDTSGWLQLSLSTSLAMVASGITAYLWLTTITSRNSALIGSVIYMLLPYHLAVDLYWRFALSEYWSFVWMPLILYFCNKIIHGHQISIIGFAFTYALLIMTHIFSIVMFSLIPILYVLFKLWGQTIKKELVSVIIAMMLGVGLSAIYWIPAITHQKYVSMNEIITGAYDYANNLLFMVRELSDFDAFGRYLKILTVLMGLLASCAFILARTNSKVHLKRETNFWFFIAILALFMMLPASRPIWDILPLLQRIQFPWRFHIILALATTALLSLGVSSWKNKFDFYNHKYLGIGILLFMSIILAVVQILPVQNQIKIPFQENTTLIIAATISIILIFSFLKRPINFSRQKILIIVILLIGSLALSNMILIKRSLLRVGNFEKTLEISMDGLEYRTKWVSQEIFNPGAISQLGNTYSKAQITLGQGNLSIQEWKPRHIVLTTKAKTDLWLTINQFYYPGWTAKIEGKSQFLQLQPSSYNGLLRMGVPTGNHKVILTLNATLEELIGQSITAIFVFIALFVFLYFWNLQKDNLNNNISGITG